jgi:hypothetical protein
MITYKIVIPEGSYRGSMCVVPDTGSPITKLGDDDKRRGREMRVVPTFQTTL